MDEEETVETLKEAIEELMEIMGGHAILLVNILRALQEHNIDIPGLTIPSKTTH